MSRAVETHVAGYQRAQLGRVLGPAQRGVGPERRREPRVEHVLRLLPALALGRARPARRRSRRARTTRAAGGPTRAGATCTRAGCSPSSRGRSWRCASGGSARGRSLTASMAGRASSSMRQNHCSETRGSMRAPRAAAVPHGVAVGLLAAQRPARRAARPPRARGPRPRSRPPSQSGRRSRRRAVEVDRGQRRQPVAAADLEVDRVVARRDLERARAEVGLDLGVGDDRHAAAHERHDRGACRQVAIALVVGVHGDGGVGQDRHRPHGGDGDLAAALHRDRRPGTGRRRRRGARPRGRRSPCCSGTLQFTR